MVRGDQSMGQCQSRPSFISGCHRNTVSFHRWVHLSPALEEPGFSKAGCKYIAAPLVLVLNLVSHDSCSTITSGLNLLRRRYQQVDFYLTRRGIKKLKLDLTVIPEVAETWSDPHLTSLPVKAGYLATQLNKFMNLPDPNQRAAAIRRLCKTTALGDLLERNTLKSDVFCALVSVYIIGKISEYSQERLQSFPVPYSVIEGLIKDLFGEEDEEAHEVEAES